MGLTSMFTLEAEEGAASFGLGEFVVDNVIVLRNRLEEARRRRTIEVLKMRGAMHRKGEYPFTVLPRQGIVMLPLSTLHADGAVVRRPRQLRQPRARRALLGRPVPRLDRAGQRRDRHRQDADGDRVPRRRPRQRRAGDDVRLRGEPRPDLPQRGRLGTRLRADGAGGPAPIVPTYPEVASLEDHLVEIKREIDEFRPNRIAIDSLSALERTAAARASASSRSA